MEIVSRHFAIKAIKQASSSRIGLRVAGVAQDVEMKQVSDVCSHEAIQQRRQIAGHLVRGLIADADEDRSQRAHPLIAADARGPWG